MAQEWIAEWRQELASRLSQCWTDEARSRAEMAILQPLLTGDEPASEGPRLEGLEPPPLSSHSRSLVELASLGHDFAFELEQAASHNPDVQQRLETLRQEHQAWLEQRRQGLQQLSSVARELERLQKLVGAEASIARGGEEAVRLRLERWL